MLSSDLLAIAVQINVTTCLVGKPGIAKTAIVRAMAKDIEKRVYHGEGYPFVVTNAAQKPPEDIAGAPVPNDQLKVMEQYMMGALKQFYTHKRGLHLVDEFGSCSPNFRAAMLSVLEGRDYGDHHLPGVSVVVVMNPPDIATAGVPMMPADSNRLFWINWELDKKPYLDYLRGGRGAITDYPIVPDNWKEMYLAKANNLVAAFLDRNDSYIYAMPDVENATGPWPSNRSWEYAARTLAAVMSCGFALNSSHVHAAIEGWVGRTVADVFFAWVKDMDLPDPEMVLAADPRQLMQLLPQRHDRLIVALEAMASAACEARPTDEMVKRWRKAWDHLGEAINVKEDICEPAARILSKNVPAGENMPALCARLVKVRRDIGVSKQM